MKKAEIKCVLPEYILRRLQAIYGLNKSLKPQIVYTMTYFITNLRSRQDLVKKMKMSILEYNSFIQYHSNRMNKVIISGFGKYHFNRCLIPNEMNDLIAKF